MFRDEYEVSSLAKLLSGFDYVIIDTCSLMEDNFPAWMDNLVNAKDYLREDFGIYVPKSCADELKKHSKDQELDSKRIGAVRALKILKEAKKRKLLSEFKTQNQNFADNVIYTKVSEDRIRFRILVITQDKGLATDLKKLNLLHSQKGNKVAVFKISRDGRLEINKGEVETVIKVQNEGYKPRPNKTKEEKPTPRSFHRPDPNELVAKVVTADRVLRANISNPNYPLEKKKADAKTQYQNLAKIPLEKRKTLSLSFPESRLRDAMEALEKGLPIPPYRPSVPTLDKKTEAEQTEPEPKKLWYGEGSRLDAAIADCAAHYGIIFRDPSVEYFAPIHGPLNLTTEDGQEAVAALLPKLKEGKATVELKSIVFTGEKAGHSLYHAWIDFEKALPSASSDEEPKTEKKTAKPRKKAAEKPAEPSDSEEKPAKKKARKKAETPTPEESSQEAKPSKSPTEEAPEKEDFFAKAKAGERRLKANLYNPNYAPENKIRDINSQIELVLKLTKAERDQLQFGLDALRLMASLNASK